MDKNSFIDVTRYLYGQSDTCASNFVRDNVRNIRLPVASTPMKEYVQDVNRFLFSGGIYATFKNLPDDHYGAKQIQKLIKRYFTNQLFSLWETISTTGEVLITYEIFNGEVSLEFFDVREFEPKFDKEGSLKEVKVKTRVRMDGELYIYKFDLRPGIRVEYPLVKERESHNYDWQANANPRVLKTKEVQACLVKTNHGVTSNRGTSDFSYSSLNLSLSITRLEYGLDENEYFFGNPLIDSPDPSETIYRLNKKVQVLTKMPADEGGGP